MSKLQPVTRQQHGILRWKRFASYAFAAQDAAVQVVASEVVRAMMAMPLAFMKESSGFMLMAVQGLATGSNLFVAPDGRWLGGYIPSAYRGYPFRLANTPEGQQVLCFIEGSGLLSETEGELFFGEDDQPSQAVKDVLGFLTQVAQARQVTVGICALLDKHQLIQPWPIKARTDDGEREIEGFYRIDEAALNQLSAEALKELQQGGALPLAYCQLLSMQHLQKLGQLAQAHATRQAVLPQTPSGELDLSFLSKNGTFSFGNML